MGQWLEFQHVQGMIKKYVDFPHYLQTDKTNVSKFLLMIHGLGRNRCGTLDVENLDNLN